MPQHSRAAGCGIHAYVLMTNHIHLLLTPTDGFTGMMKAVGQQYAQYFNRHYQRTGPLWESRYRAHAVQDDAHLLACQRYIELNPVRAGICRSPEGYGWASYRGNAEGRVDDAITPHVTFLALDADPAGRRAHYRGLFGVPLAGALVEVIRGCTVTGRPLAFGRNIG